MEDYKYLFKVVLVGNAGVGKTCLVRKFTQGIFPPGQTATIGVDFMIKTVKVNEEKIKLQIWDTAGQERFRSITQSYYRSAHAIVLVYDISCQPTFDGLSEWISEIDHYANDKVVRILVGNKCDKREERDVPTPIGENFAQANGFRYFLETSALNSTNVERLFNEVAEQLTKEMKENEKRYIGGALNSTNVERLFNEVAEQLTKEMKENGKRYIGGALNSTNVERLFNEVAEQLTKEMKENGKRYIGGALNSTNVERLFNEVAEQLTKEMK